MKRLLLYWQVAQYVFRMLRKHDRVMRYGQWYDVRMSVKFTKHAVTIESPYIITIGPLRHGA